MKKIDCKKIFGFKSDFEVLANEEKSDFVPPIDPDYIFEEEVTAAILAGFAFNRRVLVQGLHGSGKSTHIQETAPALEAKAFQIGGTATLCHVQWYA